MIVLVDMDGVLCEWTGLFNKRVVEYAPHIDFPFLHDNSSWDMKAGLDKEGRDAVQTILTQSGFYADLEPIPGAIEALRAMKKEGHTIFIVTSPFSGNPTCASDKLDWLERHVGKGWGNRAIITSDKTAVRGDILLDDKPYITGHFEPTWEHVLFHAPYNRTISDGRRRMTDWSQWREIIHD